jgi:hypothetical protein
MNSNTKFEFDGYYDVQDCNFEGENEPNDSWADQDDRQYDFE